MTGSISLSGMVEATSDPMVVVDGTYEIRAVNAAWLEAVEETDAGDVRGLAVTDFVPTANRKEVIADLDRVLDGESIECHQQLLTTEGERRSGQCLLVPATLDSGEAGVAVVFETPVTETRADRQRRRTQIKRLYEVGISLTECDSRERVFELMIEAGEDILGIEMCIVDSVQDGQLVVEATSSAMPDEGYHEPEIDSEEGGIAAKAYRRDESILVENTQTHPDANPQGDYKSAFTVPIRGYGVFQAISNDIVAFDQTDLELVELLAGHVRGALQRLDHEQQLHERQETLEQQRRQITRLHEVAVELAQCDDEHRVYEIVVEAGEDILDLDLCIADSVRDGRFVVEATSSELPEGGYHEAPVDEGGMAGKLYKTGESKIYNTQENPDTNPQDDYQESLTVPIEGYGVFQATSYETDTFSQTDLELVELLARHAREALRRLEHDRELRDRQQELELLRQIFGRVFRHNVRNELNIIMGNAQMLEQRVSGTEANQAAAALLESTAKLLSHTEKAKQIDELIGADDELIVDSASAFVARAVAECRQEFPSSEIRDDVEDARIKAHPALATAVQTAIENSIEHNDDSVSVRVQSQVEDETVTLRIDDTGTGIPDTEITVINSGEETTMAHSTGVGLWLMKWIVEKSDGSIQLSNTPEGACVEMVLQRA
jgi:signal transduction histidine kinase